MFLNLRKKKEGILYFIISILLLETVRVKYNKIINDSVEQPIPSKKLNRKLESVVTNAALLYAVFFFWFLFDYFLGISVKITTQYPNTEILRTNQALFISGAIAYFLTTIVLRFLLVLYIKTMNEAFEFWKKLGRSIVDGSKQMIQSHKKVGETIKTELPKSVEKSVQVAKDSVKVSTYTAESLGKGVKAEITDKEKWTFDEIVGKIAQGGIPALVFIVVMGSTGLAGAAAITASLALLGGPFGMMGGLVTLGILVVISKGIGKYGFKAIFEGVLKNLYEKGNTKEEILNKIDKMYISKKLKVKLRKYISELS